MNFIKICLAVLFLTGAVSGAAAETHDVARMDPGKGTDFYGFISKAKAKDMEKFIARLGKVTLSDELKETASRADRPFTVVVLGYTYCPDMLIVAPFIESVRMANPNMITVRYYIRNDGYAELLKRQTGIDRTPAIFLAEPDGRLLEGRFYSKFPRIVQRLIDSSASSEESNSHIGDHRAGVYDDDVQSDLAELLRFGVPELEGLR
ncbi:MAG: thioredoxin family protein [Synergistaceae bacterium]|nr:thioredoxin family protein [Synergistaceae bacterium]